jgi:hypothetical protein
VNKYQREQQIFRERHVGINPSDAAARWLRENDPQERRKRRKKKKPTKR